MERFKTEAVLLRTVDFGEADRIIHAMTPTEGRVTAIAKNYRKSVKRFPGTLDLLNFVELEVSRRPDRIGYVSKATLVSPFLKLREHPIRFALGCYLVELLGRLAPEGGEPGEARALFGFTLSALRAIEVRFPDARLRLFLELRALVALGLRPELNACVRCGIALQGRGEFGFHVADGGALCGRCRRGIDGLLPIHLGTLRALDQGTRLNFDQIDRLQIGAHELAEAELVIGRFHRFHVGLELRSEAFLREALSGVARRPAEGDTPPPQWPGGS